MNNEHKVSIKLALKSGFYTDHNAERTIEVLLAEVYGLEKWGKEVLEASGRNAVYIVQLESKITELRNLIRKKDEALDKIANTYFPNCETYADTVMQQAIIAEKALSLKEKMEEEK